MNRSQDARTPLHWAASTGSIDIVRFLIDQQAEVEKSDGLGWTPLHIAGSFVVFFFVLHVDVLICICCTSVSAGHENVVQELIGAGSDVNKYGAA